MTFARIILIFSDLDIPQTETFEDLGLGSPHTGFLIRLRVIVPEQMQDAVHDQKLHLRLEGMARGLRLRLRARDRDQDVAQITGARLGVCFGGRER